MWKHMKVLWLSQYSHALEGGGAENKGVTPEVKKKKKKKKKKKNNWNKKKKKKEKNI